MRSLTSQTSSQYFVYVLLSLKDFKFYVGFAEDLSKRLREHELGYVKSTTFRRPFVLIHFEMFIFKEDALAREVFLKSGFGRNQLRKSLKTTLVKLLR